ncbi:hypothetical protein LQZ18_08240 [Lachnospiraceae bacterium ZAX-1]
MLFVNILFLQAHDVLKDAGRFIGKKVVLVGSGMTGLETAEVLVENGNTVVMIEMLIVYTKIPSYNRINHENEVINHMKLTNVNDTEIQICEIERLIKEFKEKFNAGTSDPENFISMNELEQMWGNYGLAPIIYIQT